MNRVAQLGLALGLACGSYVVSAPTVAAEAGIPGALIYIGTQGEGLLGARLDTATGRLTLLGTMARIKRPTWVTPDPDRPVLYTVSELGNDGKQRGRVISMAVDRQTGALRELSNVDSTGGGPTYLSYDPRSSTVFVSNFGGGQVAAIPVGQDGRLSPAASVQTDYATGPHPKQNLPHAHGAIPDPSGHFVVTPDMGTDRIFVYRFDAPSRTLSPATPAFEATEPATGPRHAVFSTDGRYLFAIIELTDEVRSFSWDAQAGRLKPIQAVALDGPDFKGVRSGGEVIISRDGKFLYATNRARSMLEAFAIDSSNGTLRPVQEIWCNGTTPRTIAIDPSGRWMLVANEDSKSLTVFRVNSANGKLSPVGTPVSVEYKPSGLAFVQ
jgi:6-phosphogluconolactonase